MFSIDIARNLYNGYVKLVLRVREIEIDKENNTSTVEWELWLERVTTYVYNLNNTSVASVTFNDDVILEKNVSYDLRNNQWVSFGKGRKVIKHDDNGEKSFTVWARLTDVAGLGNIGWFSGTVTLTKIDRESKVKKVTASTLGQAVTVEIDRKLETHTHEVSYRVNGSEWAVVGTNIAYATEFIPPIELANNITASETGSLDIRVKTFVNGKQLGKDAYSNGNSIKVPANLLPTFEALELTESNAKMASILPELNYLQNNSVISANIKNASSVYGATITAYKITARSSVVYGQRGDIIPDTPGVFDVIGEVTDSRGRKFTRSQQVTVHGYSNPTINVFLPLRSGNRTNRNVKAQTSVTVPEIRISGRNINEYTIQVEYSARYSDGTQQWATALRERSSQPQFTKSLDLGNVYDLEKSYDFSLLVTDRFGNTAKSSLPIGTAKTLAVFTKDGFALGAIPEDDEKNLFLCSMPAKFKNNVFIDRKELPAYIRDLIYPIGSLHFTTTNTNPATYLGGAWERYAKGRTIVGVDEAQNEFNTAGKIGGTKDLPLPYIGGNGVGPGNGLYLDISKMGRYGNSGRGWTVHSGTEVYPASEKSNGYDKLQPYITTYIWRRTA